MEQRLVLLPSTLIERISRQYHRVKPDCEGQNKEDNKSVYCAEAFGDVEEIG